MYALAFTRHGSHLKILYEYILFWRPFQEVSNRACLKNCLKVDFFFFLHPSTYLNDLGLNIFFCLFVLLSVYHSVFKYSLFAFNPWTIELKGNSNNLTRILLTTNCSNCSTKQAVIFKKHKNIFFRRTSSDSRGEGWDLCPSSCGTVFNGSARDSTDQGKWRHIHQEWRIPSTETRSVFRGTLQKFGIRLKKSKS